MMNVSSASIVKRVAVIVGVGPKLGLSIARKFAHKGYNVAILARDEDKLKGYAEDIANEEKVQVFAIRIDCSDSKSIKDAFEGVLSLGNIHVLVYNVYPYQSGSLPSFLNLPVEYFQKCLNVSVVGAYHCAQQVLPHMVEKGSGTIIFTGCSASVVGNGGLYDICCGKFALRGLSQCLAKDFQPLGIHVVHVIIDGIMRAQPRIPREVKPKKTYVLTSTSSSSVIVEQQCSSDDGYEYMDPDAVAQTYWQLHIQDRSAWTQEIDLRPHLSNSMYYM